MYTVVEYFILIKRFSLYTLYVALSVLISQATVLMWWLIFFVHYRFNGFYCSNTGDSGGKTHLLSVSSKEVSVYVLNLCKTKSSLI